MLERLLPDTFKENVFVKEKFILRKNLTLSFHGLLIYLLSNVNL